MNKLKIKDNIDLDVLINYGFRISEEKEIYGYNIYCYDIENNGDIDCEILVNTTEYNDRVLRFYYSNALDNNITYEYLEDEEGNYVGEGVDEVYPIDYDIPIPPVIFKLIQDNIVEIC